MFTRSRVLLVAIMVLVGAAAFTAWTVWQVKGDLQRAESSVDAVISAIDADDAQSRDAAIDDLQDAASSASGRTDGLWWSVMTRVPFVGDDAAGVRALSASLDIVASEAVSPVADTLAGLGEVSTDGRIDLVALEGFSQPLMRSRDAMDRAAAEVAGLDSSGYVAPLRGRFDEYARRVAAAASSLASAETAVDVLPGMLGADGPRDYFFLFQNNAEIRATGGMPGSWAQLHAEDGSLELVRQGTASDFPRSARPVVPMTREEVSVYSEGQGTFFQNPGTNPDFPRAAEFWHAHWDARFPDTPIDGVLALDPVGMSYLLDGTGPVQLDDVTLTRDNFVSELLDKPYRTLGTSAQDALFQDAARAVFDAITGDLASPRALVEGLDRAAGEGRFLVASFNETEATTLATTAVAGALPQDDGRTPFVDIDVNDMTQSKMSYYLRYWADVQATSCDEDSGTQQLEGSMSLNQVISPADAAALPVSVTGGPSPFGLELGSQLVELRIHGPHGGSIDEFKVDGRVFEPAMATLDDRPVATLAVALTTRDKKIITWAMTTGAGHEADGQVGMTPSIVPGNKGSVFH